MKRPGPHFNYIIPGLLLIGGFASVAGNCVHGRRQAEHQAESSKAITLPATQRLDTSPARNSSPTKAAKTDAEIQSNNPKSNPVPAQPTPAYRPYPAYTEVFKGLATKDWYYHQYNASLTLEHRYNAHRKRGFDPDDIHAIPLLRLKKGDRLRFEDAPAFENMQKTLNGSDVIRLAFMRGEREPNEDLSSAPFDTPICTIRMIKRETTHQWFNDFTVASATEIQPLPGFRGVQILSEPQPVEIGEKVEGEFVTAVECVVRESEPEKELYKKLSLIHLSATLGIHVEVFKR